MAASFKKFSFAELGRPALDANAIAEVWGKGNGEPGKPPAISVSVPLEDLKATNGGSTLRVSVGIASLHE